MSSVLGMMLPWGSTIKVNIELPVATRYRRDMTEKLLKATLNPNKQQREKKFLLQSHNLSEDSDQPGHPPSLISLRCPHEEPLDP